MVIIIKEKVLYDYGNQGYGNQLKNKNKPLAKSVLISLGLTAAA